MLKSLISTLFLAPLLLALPAQARTGAGLTAPRSEERWRGKSSATEATVICKPGAQCKGWFPRDLVRLKSGPGWRVRRPHHSWGTPLTVARLRTVFQARRRQFPAAPAVPVYDLSRQMGGQLEGHYSHRRGRDSDLGIPSLLNGRTHWRQRDRDMEHTLFMVLALLRTCDVEFILLDWEVQRLLLHHAMARGITANEVALLFQAPGRGPFGLIRHRAKHRRHVHVRFRKEASSDEPPRRARIMTDRESLEELCTADAGRPLIEKIFSRLYQ